MAAGIFLFPPSAFFGWISFDSITWPQSIADAIGNQSSQSHRKL